MDDISKILSSLSSEDINMLKGMADSILGGGNHEEAPAPTSSPTPAPPPKSGTEAVSPLGGLNLGANDLAMIMKVKHAYDRISQSSTNNQNTQLIQALKPHLSEKRQRRADEALQLMHMMDLLPLLKELF